MRLFEEFCYTTVRLFCENSKGEQTIGTGFFYKNDNGNLYIITNKHVIEGVVKIEFLIHRCDEKQNPVFDNITIEQNGRIADLCLFHKDDTVDLCAINANWVYDKNLPVKNLFVKCFTPQNIPSKSQIDEIDAIEDVIMIGYPDGIMDNHNNMPIFRKGITATHYKYDFNNQKEFLIDVPAIGGSSGSPILLCEQNRFKIIDNSTVVPQNRLFLLGINRAAFYYGFGLAKNKQNLTEIFSNLGVVIKSERILELFDN